MIGNLLIQEPPLQVLPTLAMKIGLLEAIVLQQLHYWLENKKAGVERNGYKWIYNTYTEWRENFPFISERTIQRTFLRLEELGVVISEQLDKHEYNRRNYYRIDYEKLELLSATACGEERCQRIAIDDDILAPSSTTETTAETNTESALSQKDLEQCNQKVDAILEGVRKSLESWSGREKMPEPVRELLDVYVEITGQKPLKGQLIDWLQTGQEWLELGITKTDIRNAYGASTPDKGDGFYVGRPGSLTRMAGMFAGKRRVKGTSTGASVSERILARLQEGRR
jgi:DNA-binding transcriptional ArsR family regulator